MKVEKYKPKYHKNLDNCNENCEKDCDMECSDCRATPWDTKYYWIIKGEQDSIQLCEKCFKDLLKELGIAGEK